MRWAVGLVISQDPDSNLDYKFDWATWLGNDTIQSYVLTVEAGLTMTTPSNDATSVSFWISGGNQNSSYTVACKITTVAGRIVERTVTFETKHY